jgi:SAM-dependent methyltransferase
MDEVPFVVTPDNVTLAMLELANVGPKDYVIDLGSGDGRIAVAAGRIGARALGVDLDPNRIREAEANARRAGVTNRVTFRQQNLFETDLSEATVLTMYLLPSINLTLRPKILGLRPGTRVVSHDFAMADWKPDLTETVNWRIHFWVVPAQVAGAWQVKSGNQDFGVTIVQSFQQIQGTATVDGRTLPLRNTRLRGREIEFAVDATGRPTNYRGTVSGDTMRGSGGAGATWMATRS